MTGPRPFYGCGLQLVFKLKAIYPGFHLSASHNYTYYSMRKQWLSVISTPLTAYYSPREANVLLSAWTL